MNRLTRHVSYLANSGRGEKKSHAPHVDKTNTTTVFLPQGGFNVQSWRIVSCVRYTQYGMAEIYALRVDIFMSLLGQMTEWHERWAIWRWWW